MISKQTLIVLADQYRLLSGDLPETTLSHRMFGDTKKLAALRGGADITVGRFNSAMRWLALEWPAEAALPEPLKAYCVGVYGKSGEDAA